MTEEIDIKQLSTKLWKEADKGKKHPELEYDGDLDVLYLYFFETGDETIVTHYIDQYVALLYKHSDNEVVGMSIEDFEKGFAPRYADRKAWKLSDSGIKFNGVREVVFALKKEEHAQVKQRAERIEIKRDISLEQQFAFA